MNHEPLKVLVVYDSALFRQTVCAALEQIAGVQMIGTAADGAEAIDKIRSLQPDVLTLDVEMPMMNGIETLRKMNELQFEARAIMLSSLTAAGAQVTLDALFEGAFDFIAKPQGGAMATRDRLRMALTEKLDAFRIYKQTRKLPPAQPFVSRQPVAQPATQNHLLRQECRAVLIGISTGGPKALRHVLPRLDAEFPVPVIVIQHMPANYTSLMAVRLTQECPLPTVEAEEGSVIARGKIYVAPGGRHLSLYREGDRVVSRLTDDPPVHSCRPSIDYTFQSAVEAYDGKVLAVIMTGMGRDGATGCQLVKSRGGTVFTQDAETSAVYGMPKAVNDAGIADRILPLGRIAAAITRHVNRSR